jgi:hypothetical protein
VAEALIFLSYSRRDARLVGTMGALVRAAGATPWRDEDALSPGANWSLVITTTIEQCARMIVFWCRHSRRSAEVEKEYLLALRCGKNVVPVRMDASALPGALEPFHAIDARPIVWLSHTLATLQPVVWLLGVLLALASVLTAHYG